MNNNYIYLGVYLFYIILPLNKWKTIKCMYISQCRSDENINKKNSKQREKV